MISKAKIDCNEMICNTVMHKGATCNRGPTRDMKDTHAEGGEHGNEHATRTTTSALHEMLIIFRARFKPAL